MWLGVEGDTLLRTSDPLLEKQMQGHGDAAAVKTRRTLDPFGPVIP